MFTSCRNHTKCLTLCQPVLKEDKFFHSKVIKDLDEFKYMCDVIVSNRLSKELFDVEEKVYTRDLFRRD